MVGPPDLDAKCSHATLLVGRTQHRQARREPITTSRGPSTADAIGFGEGRPKQERIGDVGAVAILGAHRLREPAQLATTAADVVDPFTVVPARRPTRERAMV